MDTASIADNEAHNRVVVDVESRRSIWISRALIACAFGWLTLLIAYDHHAADWRTPGRVTWSLSLFIAVILAARGLIRGRPITRSHAAVTVLLLLVGFGAHVFSFELLADALTASAGVSLTWPTPSRAEPHLLPRVSNLINATHGDPLAPFAMQSTKSYYFNTDATAAIAYRARLGYAVVSGDPIGRQDQFRRLAADFATMCQRHGWRIVVLGCGEQQLQIWRDTDLIGQSMRPIPVGRDVVLDLRHFSLAGRRFRNLRQAVQRTHNVGITTEVVDEQQLGSALKGELTELIHSAHHSTRTERGFSMILDHALEGRYPGVKLIIARDRAGRVQGFHRYAVAGGGSDVTLDVPWRRSGAPNGIDERLTIDMAEYSRNAGAQRLSLAFAAFPEIFDNDERGWVDSIYYMLIHLGDPLIKLESLYRYLRKYHAFGQRRYVVLSIRHLPVALAILLSLEFMPRPRVP